MFNRLKVVGRFAASCATFPVRIGLCQFEPSIQRFGAKQTKKLLKDYGIVNVWCFLLCYVDLGLKYHDIMIETPEVLEAIDRLSAEERTMMDRRVMRAFDCSLKHKPLPKEIQDQGETLDDSDVSILFVFLFSCE